MKKIFCLSVLVCIVSVTIAQIYHSTIKIYNGKVYFYNGSAWTCLADSTQVSGGGVSQQTLNDSANAIRTTVNGKAAAAHSHAISDVTNLQSGLDGKAASSHSHAQSDVTGLTTALSNGLSRANHTGTQATSTITGYQGYAINVQALTSSPGDGATIYFGTLPKAPTTSAAQSKIYIAKAGTIKAVIIYCYSGTAGSNENWSVYVRLNNTTDNLIQTVGASTNERRFENTSLSIAVSVGDYVEIKCVNPTFATNPATTIFGGYIYIE